MSNAVGIVCEYNPLHNGHIYHIERSRRAASADVVVCAMSGDFVQRGGPAVLDKWDRAGIALNNGVDVVLEIPVYQALGNASIYAASGVKILEALGAVTHISFGSECGDITAIKRVASNLDIGGQRLKDLTGTFGRQGSSYPAARQAAYEQLYHDSPDLAADISILSSPNDILAVEYVRSMTKAVPVAVKRTGAGHGSSTEHPDGSQSATFIRGLISEGSDIRRYVPFDPASVTMNLLDDKLFDLARYRLLTMGPDDGDSYPSGGEGLLNRLRTTAVDAKSLDEMILMTKSRRYTYTHVSRLIMEVVLGLRKDAGIPESPGYIRVLGATGKGRELLNRVKRDGLASLPVITNINKERNKLTDAACASLDLDIRAADIYNLMAGNNVSLKSDHKMTAIMVDN